MEAATAKAKQRMIRSVEDGRRIGWGASIGGPLAVDLKALLPTDRYRGMAVAFVGALPACWVLATRLDWTGRAPRVLGGGVVARARRRVAIFSEPTCCRSSSIPAVVMR